MKKTISLLIVCLMLLSLAACGGGAGKTEQPEPEAPMTIADDTSIYEMRITPPESYESVERYTDKSSDGAIVEKDINYNLTDGSKISYGCMKGQILAELTDISKLESKEINGITYYFLDKSGDYCAFAQKENDLYAVQYTPVEGGDGSLLDELIAGVRYEESEEPVVDDVDLFDIQFTVDEALPMAGTSVNVTATPAGDITRKSVMWKYGEDPSDLDFRFTVIVCRNATLESVLDAEKEFETKTVGELEYTVLKTEDDAPYDYFIRHGEDVYEIRNSGSYSGWSVTRSEESVAAFEAFINSVSFN